MGLQITESFKNGSMVTIISQLMVISLAVKELSYGWALKKSYYYHESLFPGHQVAAESAPHAPRRAAARLDRRPRGETAWGGRDQGNRDVTATSANDDVTAPASDQAERPKPAETLWFRLRCVLYLCKIAIYSIEGTSVYPCQCYIWMRIQKGTILMWAGGLLNDNWKGILK